VNVEIQNPTEFIAQSLDWFSQAALKSMCSSLEQLLAAGLRRYVVRQLSETTVVVDHQRLADMHKLLKRLGETPRVTAE